MSISPLLSKISFNSLTRTLCFFLSSFLIISFAAFKNESLSLPTNDRKSCFIKSLFIIRIYFSKTFLINVLTMYFLWFQLNYKKYLFMAIQTYAQVAKLYTKAF